MSVRATDHVAPAGQPPSAMLADDQEPFRRAAQQLLIEAGFAVVAVAVDGPDAVLQAEATSPALVVLDIWMPGGDGIAAARQIRARRPGTVIVLITARDLDDLPSWTSDAEADAIVSKADLTPQIIREIWDQAHIVP